MDSNEKEIAGRLSQEQVDTIIERIAVSLEPITAICQSCGVVYYQFYRCRNSDANTNLRFFQAVYERHLSAYDEIFRQIKALQQTVDNPSQFDGKTIWAQQNGIKIICDKLQWLASRHPILREKADEQSVRYAARITEDAEDHPVEQLNELTLNELLPNGRNPGRKGITHITFNKEQSCV